MTVTLDGDLTLPYYINIGRAPSQLPSKWGGLGTARGLRKARCLAGTRLVRDYQGSVPNYLIGAPD